MNTCRLSDQQHELHRAGPAGTGASVGKADWLLDGAEVAEQVKELSQGARATLTQASRSQSQPWSHGPSCGWFFQSVDLLTSELIRGITSSPSPGHSPFV